MGGVQEGQEDSAEGGFSAGGVVPFLEGVDASSGASCSYGEGGDAYGQGDVGVGGADAGLGAEGQVAVYGAEGVEEWGVFGECSGGTAADDLRR